MLSKRLSKLSCNLEEFAKAPTPYNIAMKTRGYRGGLAYDDHAADTRAEKRNRKRNIDVLIHPLAKVLRTTSANNF